MARWGSTFLWAALLSGWNCADAHYIPMISEGYPEPPPTVDPGPDAESAASLEEGQKKVSKIFGQMKPEDAAEVLEYLSDEEIVSILQHLSERNSAPILEAFDPARAAALSRILLHSGSTGS